MHLAAVDQSVFHVLADLVSFLVWFVGLAILIGGLLGMYHWGFPALGHWYWHKANAPGGRMVHWRRKTDKVQMRGFVCPYCGKLLSVGPVPASYKRMMRGEEYY